MNTDSTALDEPASQAAFVAAMQAPGAYPLHPTDTPIRCIETHVSWVFLTGPYAYKVKKPVRLSFLDYSTAARREALCREELRLNRRHAPGLYVDVVPIAGSPAQPRVGDTAGAPFEHALRMVQFDRHCELTQLIESGNVTLREIAALGVDLARSQDAAAAADVTSAFGVPRSIHEVTLANFAEIADALQTATATTQGAGSSSSPDVSDVTPQLARLRTRSEAAFAAACTLMQARRAAGRVRECHGDLHCGNVVRWHDRLVPFDGLEFDPALRFIDVASDLAFLTMDLAARKRPDLRRKLLNAWVEASGDFDAVTLLPYYETYRALVRAKVAALRRGQDAAGAARAVRESHRYLDWAAAQCSRDKPVLVLMAGLSGSGKTWLARQLAPQFDALHVRSDVERKRLAGLGPLDSSESPADAGIYTREFNERTYARLLHCARACLEGRESVIVDAASLRQVERRQFAALAHEAGVAFTLVHCSAPVATLKSRIADRRQAGADASEATVELLDRQPRYWEPFTPQELGHVVEIDTAADADIEVALAQVRARWRRETG